MSGILIFKKQKVSNAHFMFTCAVLHNMLLHYDGFDKLWTEEDWLTSDPVDSDDEESKENKEHNAKKRFMIRPDRVSSTNR